jgi:hypothetical protein
MTPPRLVPSTMRSSTGTVSGKLAVSPTIFFCLRLTIDRQARFTARFIDAQACGVLAPAAEPASMAAAARNRRVGVMRNLLSMMRRAGGRRGEAARTVQPGKRL